MTRIARPIWSLKANPQSTQGIPPAMTLKIPGDIKFHDAFQDAVTTLVPTAVH